MLIFNIEVSLKGRGQKHSFLDFLVHRGEARFATAEGKKMHSQVSGQLRQSWLRCCRGRTILKPTLGFAATKPAFPLLNIASLQRRDPLLRRSDSYSEGL